MFKEYKIRHMELAHSKITYLNEMGIKYKQNKKLKKEKEKKKIRKTLLNLWT